MQTVKIVLFPQIVSQQTPLHWWLGERIILTFEAFEEEPLKKVISGKNSPLYWSVGRMSFTLAVCGEGLP